MKLINQEITLVEQDIQCKNFMLGKLSVIIYIKPKNKFMNTKIISFVLLLNFYQLTIFSQNIECCEIQYHKVNNIEYALFPQCPSNNVPRWFEYAKAPLISDVLKADSLAFIYIKNLKELRNQGFDNCPIIKDNWDSYYRQVICYIKKKNKRRYDEIIYISYIHKSQIEEFEKYLNSIYYSYGNWKKYWFSVNGGCSKYFHIFYDVRKKKIVGFVVN